MRVLLTGIPGNLTISWDGHYVLPHLLRCGRLVRAVAEARATARHGTSCSALRTLAGGTLPLLPRWAGIAVQSLRQSRLPWEPWTRYSLIRPAFAREQRIGERAIASGHDLYFLPAESSRAKTLLRKDIVADIGRGHLSMFGVETRHPPDDQRLVEFCLGLPEDQFHRKGTSRWLIRRAMHERLPPDILNNRRRGLQAADWAERYRARHRQLLNEVDLIHKSPLAGHAIDVQRLRDLVNSFDSGTACAGQARLHHRALLETGIMTGAFLRWVESGSLSA